jgi:hypothetical protein
MPTDTEENVSAHEYMQGILNQICNSGEDAQEIKNLMAFLNEKDRRRQTNWRNIFPWLTEYENYVV